MSSLNSDDCDFILPGASETQVDSYGYDTLFYEGIEDLDQYRPGGLHPILLGDTLGEGRFQVVNKLGSGGFATVWLCADLEEQRYVAIKVLGAKASTEATNGETGEIAILKHFKNTSNGELSANHICLAEDYFVETGPNGQHICLILPVLGRNIKNICYQYGDDPGVLKDICAQMVTAMKYLHEHGVCHGDFRSANILVKIPGFENATDEEVSEMFPGCYQFEVGPIPATGADPGPHLPRFVYTSAEFEPLQGQSLTEIVVSDFGEAYLVDRPPALLGIPLAYAAPEVFVGKDFGFGFPTDVWSLGATICEVRQGSTSFNDGSVLEAVQHLEKELGPLPEPYRSVWNENGFERLGNLPPASQIPLTEPVSWNKDVYDESRREWLQHCGHTTVLEKIVRTKYGFGHLLEDGEEVKSNQRVVPGGWVWTDFQIPPDEADQLLDLLSRIFKYSPDERLTILEIINHPWFSDDLSRPDMVDTKGDEIMDNVLVDADGLLTKDVGQGPHVHVADRATDQKPKGVNVCDVQREDKADVQNVKGSAKTDFKKEEDTITDAALRSPLVDAEAEDGNERWHDAEDIPAPPVPAGWIVRICKRLWALLFLAIWRVGRG
ncbi:kinase-like protein [Coniochaeta sp. PMI_546]|nr:kinase-like protein [Coniochaeta sp. PMI_546]